MIRMKNYITSCKNSFKSLPNPEWYVKQQLEKPPKTTKTRIKSIVNGFQLYIETWNWSLRGKTKSNRDEEGNEKTLIKKEYVEKISDLVMDCNNLSRDISFILFVFEELSYVSKKLAATTLTLKYDLMVLKYDLIKDYLIFIKNDHADILTNKSMSTLKNIFKIIEQTSPMINSRIKFLEDSYYLTN